MSRNVESRRGWHAAISVCGEKTWRRPLVTASEAKPVFFGKNRRSLAVFLWSTLLRSAAGGDDRLLYPLADIQLFELSLN